MEVSGYVLAMRNHEPMQNILVGIHRADSGWNAFIRIPPYYAYEYFYSDRAKFVIA